MHPRSKKHLWDMLDAAEAIDSRFGGVSADDFRACRVDRWAVERGIEIVGDAARLLAERDPETADTIPGIRDVIEMAAFISGEIDPVDSDRVVSIVRGVLPGIIASTRALLSE